ncbi:MAG: NrsF family protein [Leptospiraceae bacterium]|nr:NrsF family protein [Leptospiraceae bacterium]
MKEDRLIEVLKNDFELRTNEPKKNSFQILFIIIFLVISFYVLSISKFVGWNFQFSLDIFLSIIVACYGTFVFTKKNSPETSFTIPTMICTFLVLLKASALVLTSPIRIEDFSSMHFFCPINIIAFTTLVGIVLYSRLKVSYTTDFLSSSLLVFLTGYSYSEILLSILCKDKTGQHIFVWHFLPIIVLIIVFLNRVTRSLRW